MNHLETALIQSEGELEKLQTDFDEQQTELEQSRQRNRKTEKTLLQSEKRCHQQEAIIETLRAQLRDEQSSNCKVHANSRDDLQVLADALAKVQRELEISDEDAARFEEEANQAEDECARVSKALKRMKRQVKDLESELDSELDSNDDLQEQIKEQMEDNKQENAARKDAEKSVAELERQLESLKAGVQEHLKAPSPINIEIVGTKDNGCSCNSNTTDKCEACEAIRPAEICLEVQGEVASEVTSGVKSRASKSRASKSKAGSKIRRDTKGPAAPPMPPIACIDLEDSLAANRAPIREDDSWITPRDDDVDSKPEPQISPALERGSPSPDQLRVPVSATRRIFGSPKIFAVGVE
jgi:hypothetical protein